MWSRSYLRGNLHKEDDEGQETDSNAGGCILRELLLLDDRLKRLIIHSSQILISIN